MRKLVGQVWGARDREKGSNFFRVNRCFIKGNNTANLNGVQHILYFFGYKTEFFFQTNPKNLDPSYKMDLDLWDCLGSKIQIIVKFHRTDLVICRHSREWKTCLISE